jgi:hypothetical protein
VCATLPLRTTFREQKGTPRAFTQYTAIRPADRIPLRATHSSCRFRQASRSAEHAGCASRSLKVGNCSRMIGACVASFAPRLIGDAAKTQRLEFQFQSNMRRSCPVLSVVTLALLLARKGRADFPSKRGAALRRLRYHHPALLIRGETSRSERIIAG